MNNIELFALKKAAIVLDALAKKLDYSAGEEAKCLAKVVLETAVHIEELKEDIKFLADRQTKASTITFGGDEGRFTGASSNSIVSIIYGREKRENQYMPSDSDDYLACWRTIQMLPHHHRPLGQNLLFKAYESLENRYKKSVDIYLESLQEKENAS